jgi:hypothetical protein
MNVRTKLSSDIVSLVRHSHVVLCMSTYMYAFMHIINAHIHTRTHAHTHIYIHAHIQTYSTHTYIYKHARTRTCAHTKSNKHTHKRTLYIHVIGISSKGRSFVYKYVHTCIHILMFTYMHVTRPLHSLLADLASIEHVHTYTHI